MKRLALASACLALLTVAASGAWANPIPTQITLGPSSAGTVTASPASETFSGVWGWAYQGANSGNPGYTLANATLAVVGGGGGFYTLAANAENFTVNIGANSLSGTLSLNTVDLKTPGVAFFVGTLTVNSASAGFQSTGYRKGAVVNADFVTYQGNVSSGQLTPSVPEPSSLALLGTGVLGLAGLIRSKMKN